MRRSLHAAGIEVDGRAAHDDWSDRFDDDRARHNDLLAAGWRVLRFTWAHLQDPEYVLRQIAQLVAAQRRKGCTIARGGGGQGTGAFQSNGSISRSTRRRRLRGRWSM